MNGSSLGEARPFAVDAAPFLLRFASERLFASGEQYGFGLDLLLDSIAGLRDRRLRAPRTRDIRDALCAVRLGRSAARW
jgi:hypothetical protein